VEVATAQEQADRDASQKGEYHRPCAFPAAVEGGKAHAGQPGERRCRRSNGAQVALPQFFEIP